MVAAEGRRANRTRKNNWFWLGGEEEVALILVPVPDRWKGEAPQVIKKMQLVYCHIALDSGRTASWLEMMQTLLPNFRATLQLSGQDYVLILDQDQFTCGRYLKDTVSAMEYDFNIYLSWSGKLWTESKDGKVSPVIRAERAVFRAWIRKAIKVSIAFSTLSVGNRAGRFGSHQSRPVYISWLKVKINCKTSLLLFGTIGQLNPRPPSNSISTAIRSNTRLTSGGGVDWSSVEKSDRSSPVLSFGLTRCDLNGIIQSFCNLHKTSFLFCETCHRFVKRFHLQ